MEGCWLVKRDGTILSLKKNITGSSDYVPTYVPACSDRAVTTRSTTATAERRQRNLPEQSFVFNLSNEVCMKYSIFTVADRGLRPWQWTSSRLQGEVLYLETRKSAFHLDATPAPSCVIMSAESVMKYRGRMGSRTPSCQSRKRIRFA